MTGTQTLANLREIRELWCQHFLNEQGRITAWTFVPQAIVSDVMTGNIQECPVDLSEDNDLFRMAYQWMMESMDESGISGRKTGISPWWCWITVGDGHTKPTNRHADESSVLLELSLHPDEVLLSDFQMWHVPLNYWINAEDEAEEAFERELKSAGFNIWSDKPLPEPFHSRVIDGWRDIFRLDRVNGFTCELEEKGIQGVFWKLRPEIIKGIVQPAVFIEDDES